MSLFLSAMLAMAPAVTLVKDEKTEEKVAEKDQIVCKRFPPPVGSRMGARKVCATKAEWAIHKLDQDNHMDRVQNRTSLQSN